MSQAFESAYDPVYISAADLRIMEVAYREGAVPGPRNILEHYANFLASVCLEHGDYSNDRMSELPDESVIQESVPEERARYQLAAAGMLRAAS